MALPDKDEERAFQEIVAHFRVRRRGRVSLLLGITLCLTAAVLITFGGASGAMLAVIPWMLGIVTVVRSRAWH